MQKLQETGFDIQEPDMKYAFPVGGRRRGQHLTFKLARFANEENRLDGSFSRFIVAYG
jgi:hypothetical protein